MGSHSSRSLTRRKWSESIKARVRTACSERGGEGLLASVESWGLDGRGVVGAFIARS